MSLKSWMIEGAIRKDGFRRRVVVAKIKKKMEEAMLQNKSWKTSLGGLGMILGGLGVLGGIVTKFVNEGFGAIDQSAISAGSLAFTSISGGVALLFARDNDKSSESVGAKPNEGEKKP